MAKLQFVPWVSGGAAATVPRAASGVNRAPLDVAVAITSTAGPPSPASATPTVSLLGPGDVTGIPGVHILRSEPQDGATGVETTLFPSVEFDVAAIPWLFTSAAPGGAQVTPWLCLVVVAAQAGVTLDRAAGLLTISPPARPAVELPDLSQTVYWAHAQYTGVRPADGASAAIAMADPAAALSRLVCPRALQPDVTYYGCVVPTTSVGQAAGLGGTPADDAPISYAWPAPDSSQTVTLPVYFSFTFSTGGAGDFKSLAAKLAHPPDVVLPSPGALGQRTLTVAWSDPGGGNAQVETVPMPTILSVPTPPTVSPSPPVPPPQGPGPGVGPGGPSPPTPVYPTAAAWLAAQFTPDLASPRLTAPLYGSVQAGVTTAQIAAGSGLPQWLTDVSADPRLRVAAALGGQVVAAERDNLVASAFNQLGQIKPVNAQFSRAQLARAVGDRQVSRHLTGSTDLATLQLISPIAARLPVTAEAGPGTAYSIAASTVADPALPAMASAAYRRVSRPRGPHAQAVPTPALPAGPIPAATLLGPLGSGAVTVRVRSDYVSPPTLASATGHDPLRALAPSVEFDTPMIGPLATLAPDAILYGAGSIPMNTALPLRDNPDVIAAYLIGANDRLEHLLQWGDVPTDRTATPFRWFWAYSDQAAIAPLADWGPTALSAHLGGPNMVLAVRGELFLRYPRTAVYAVPAQASGPRFPVPPAPGQIIPPTFTWLLPPDLRLYVFTTITLTDPGQLAGIFIVFQQQFSETRFGTDALAPAPPSGGSYWSVSDVQASAATANGGSAVVIGDAAQMAACTCTQPGLVAINALTLLPPGPAAGGSSS